MRVFVLGGAGGVGAVATRVLAGHPAVDEVAIGDIAVERAERICARIGSDKVSVVRADLHDLSGLMTLLKGYDVLLNLTWDELNPMITEVALRTPISMVDLTSSMDGHELKVFAKHREAQDAGITLIVELGSDPGIANVFARYAADRLDTVDTISIRDADRDFTPHETIFKFTVKGILEEWTWDAIVWENGEYHHYPPLSTQERVEFPEPVGTQTCYLTPHEEPITLPLYLGKPVRRVDFMLNHPYEVFQMLKRLQLLGTKPIPVKGAMISPVEFLGTALHRVQASEAKLERPVDDVACQMTRVVGIKDGKRIEHKLTSMVRSRADWNACGTLIHTAVPAAIGAAWVGTGKVGGPGVLSPEACIDPEPFFEELERHGIRILKEERVLGPA